MRSGVKPFSEGAGLADGNGISGNAVKGEGAKEANSNEESFRGQVEVREGIDPFLKDIGLRTQTK